jgi:hypothetical protein
MGVFALTIALAYSTNAQTSPAELHIKLDDATCKGVEQVSVVINGRDNPRLARQMSKCEWKLEEIGKHNLDISYFSLRLHGYGRTPCEHATPIDKSNNLNVSFTKRGQKEAHELEISGDPLDYVRKPSTRYSGVSCSEAGFLPGTLYDVQFDIEDLRLGLFEKKPVGCGVILYDIAGKARKGDSLEITFKQIVPAVVKEGIEGKNCYAPTFIPPEAIEQLLRRKAPVKITVK